MSVVRGRSAAAAAVLAAAIAGCGPAAPAPAPPRTLTVNPARAITPASGSTLVQALSAPTLAQVNRTHELTSRRRLRVTVAGYWSTPAGAITAFAFAYINWTAADVVEKLRALAAVSLGPARSAMQMAQARAAADPTLSRDSVTDTGVVEAVTQLAGGAGLWLVVTRELTSSRSGEPFSGGTAGWHVTLARVTRLARGEWVVSAWQPES